MSEHLHNLDEREILAKKEYEKQQTNVEKFKINTTPEKIEKKHEKKKQELEKKEKEKLENIKSDLKNIIKKYREQNIQPEEKQLLQDLKRYKSLNVLYLKSVKEKDFLTDLLKNILDKNKSEKFIFEDLDLLQ